MIGRSIAGHRITAPLGEGGMGEACPTAGPPVTVILN